MYKKLNVVINVRFVTINKHVEFVKKDISYRMVFVMVLLVAEMVY